MSTRLDLEFNPEFWADLRDDKLSRDSIAEKWGASAGYVSSRRVKARAGFVPVAPTGFEAEGAPTGEPPERTEIHDEESGKRFEFVRNRPVTLEDARELVRSTGDDPDLYNYSIRAISYGKADDHRISNKISVWPKTGADERGPEWPVIQAAAAVDIHFIQPEERPAREGLKLSLKCADPQIGFRAVAGGYEEFHDWRAMQVFVEVCRREQPDSIIILGDYLDLPSQGKYVQEAGFARTTQKAIDEGHVFLALLRAACPEAEIVLVEGNHDKRMQNFIEQNALAAFGLRRANLPAEWPVMSLPNLLRLDELRVSYMDAYPAAAHWDNDRTRNIHGTRANSKGSTMAQYSNDAPHINTWAGHTHRTEIIYKTVIGPRGEAIESYAANPGCLCKTDGTVPSVHGALHTDGTSARVVEDWQQGFGALLYGDDGLSWPQVYRIRDGRSVYGGVLIEQAWP